MRVTLVIILGLAYVLNSPILEAVYPNAFGAKGDYYQYIEYVAVRFKFYDCVYLLFFWLVFLLSKTIVKSIAAGMMVLTAGSVIDKIFFGFSNYLYTDVLLVIIAIIISIKAYVREVR